MRVTVHNAAWIPGEEVNFHTAAPWGIKHIAKNMNFVTSAHERQIRPAFGPCSDLSGAQEICTEHTDESVHHDKLQHAVHW